MVFRLSVKQSGILTLWLALSGSGLSVKQRVILTLWFALTSLGLAVMRVSVGDFGKIFSGSKSLESLILRSIFFGNIENIYPHTRIRVS